ncbi:S-adenosyl-L-methionine-dependent methyltransferase [Xylona heveae TC161]|uniref:S-adenosyl-L-methionine-dependent methyltransferase n=1 Tax=Xylona heveae (strain CBS 132557 / TC161) TaxID=1328760 RepID=A0A165AEF7_XYLHT|nr:S-adenosyl-L-methionine-dependent methyltransferase [Xylona heveae TC161]KZF20342.1 S-adenosyl-L-methionine-dependent methyltransferase [Xylona heveae TC161]
MASHSERNREYFDSMAARYHTEPWIQEGVAMIAEGVDGHRDWIGIDPSNVKNDQPSHKRSIRLLDFACGPGIISQVLGPHVSQVRGIDVSEKMIEEYNKSAIAQEKGKEFMHAVQGDLLDPAGADKKLDLPDLYEFDLAVVSLAMHHFEDPDLAVRRIGERLKKGSGVLLVIDFLDGSSNEESIFQRVAKGHKVLTPAENEKLNALPAAQRQRIETALNGATPTIKNPAFSKARMEELFKNNGFGKNFEFLTLEGNFERMGVFSTKLFMSKAQLS